MPRAASTLSFAAIALLGSFLAGCGGGSTNANGCGTHQYSYVGAGLSAVGGAPWYSGDYGGGWYDPGDDGSDYADESASANGGSSSSDGSGNAYGSGSGDDGSGDDGSYNSGDDGSGDDGSGDDGSGDDGSGDDSTSSKKHLHTASVSLHTQSGASSASSVNACYAYSCDLLCAVGSPAIAEREAKGYSSLNSDDACQVAAHGVETWAHDSLGADVSACRLGGSDIPASTTEAPRTPAAPSVVEGFSSSTSGTRTQPLIVPTIR